MAIDTIESMRGEQREAMAILAQAFPARSPEELWHMAIVLRSDRYARGRYLTPEEISRQWPPKYDKWGAR